MLNVRRTMVSLLLVATSSTGWTQTAAEFPAEAKMLSAEALSQRVSEKVFNVVVARGPAWRLQLNENGYFFINAGNYADSGKWRVEESKVCWQPQRGNAGCNEMRLVSDMLHMKRDNGEIVKLEPR